MTDMADMRERNALITAATLTLDYWFTPSEAFTKGLT